MNGEPKTTEECQDIQDNLKRKSEAEQVMTIPSFNVQCSKCGKKFESQPGILNSTQHLGKVSMLHGAGGYLPQCPHCDNFRDNQLVNPDKTLSTPVRF